MSTGAAGDTDATRLPKALFLSQHAAQNLGLCFL